MDPDVTWSETWDDEPPWPGDAEYEPAAGAQGLRGRSVVLLGFASAGGCAALNLALAGGQLTFFFDLCFVVICLVTAMAVRRTDLFTVGVLPPLLYAGVIGVVSVVAPDAFGSPPGVTRVFLTGLADHAAGLVGGYTVALLTVAARIAGTPGQRRS